MVHSSSGPGAKHDTSVEAREHLKKWVLAFLYCFRGRVSLPGGFYLFSHSIHQASYTDIFWVISCLTFLLLLGVLGLQLCAAIATSFYMAYRDQTQIGKLVQNAFTHGTIFLTLVSLLLAPANHMLTFSSFYFINILFVLFSQLLLPSDRLIV